jgi:GNAT superfamily N-acetyltransferase
MSVAVREYTPKDYKACRDLWVELTQHHREIYGDPTIGGEDPGSGFDAYLEVPERVGSWVAATGDQVVGLTGLFDHGPSGEVEPVIVAASWRHHGIGRALIEWVVAEASERGFEYLAIRPVARNVAAIQSFYASGFRNLGGHIDLTMDLKERRHTWLDGVKLHGREFQY